MEDTNKSTDKRNGLGHDVLIFLFGPLIFLFLVKFTGYQIFYSGDPTDKERKRMVILLSSGAVLYLLIIVILVLTNE